MFGLQVVTKLIQHVELLPAQDAFPVPRDVHRLNMLTERTVGLKSLVTRFHRASGPVVSKDTRRPGKIINKYKCPTIQHILINSELCIYENEALHYWLAYLFLGVPPLRPVLCGTRLGRLLVSDFVEHLNM